MPFEGGNSTSSGGSGTVTSIGLSSDSGSTTAITTIDGSGADTLVTKSVDYDILTTDKFILSDLATAGADITFTMPTSSTSGQSWHIISTDSVGTYKTIIDGNGGNINNATTYNLIGPHAAISIVSDGTNYFVF
jgi:hypothetical protein